MAQINMSRPEQANKSTNEKQPKNDRRYYSLGLRIVVDFGAAIAVPVVVFVLLGQYLDDHFGLSPLFTILGFVLAALISAKIIYKKAKYYGREYQKLDSDKK